MGQNAYPVRSSEAEVVHTDIRVQGTGAANPTVEYGAGLTVLRVGVGVFEVTFKENPGFYIGGPAPGLEATVPANLKGYTVIPGNYNPATLKIQFSIFNSAFAAAELAAAQWLNIALKFKRSKV